MLISQEAANAAIEIDWGAVLSWVRRWLPLLISAGALLISVLSYRRAGRAEVNKTQRQLRAEVRRIVQSHKDHLHARSEAYEPWKDHAALKSLPGRIKDDRLRKELLALIPKFEDYENHLMNARSDHDELAELRWQVKYFEDEAAGKSRSFSALIHGPVPDAPPEASEIERVREREQAHQKAVQELSPQLRALHERIIGILNETESKHG